jgi:hypothetical protein
MTRTFAPAPYIFAPKLNPRTGTSPNHRTDLSPVPAIVSTGTPGNAYTKREGTVRATHTQVALSTKTKLHKRGTGYTTPGNTPVGVLIHKGRVERTMKGDLQTMSASNL